MAISQARTQLPSLVDKVSKTLERVILTVNGKPKAVVMSVEEVESLEETAEILAIPGARKAMRQGMREIKQGKYKLLDDILAENP